MAVCLQLPQRTVRIERCLKSAALPHFGSRISAAAARTDTLLALPFFDISYPSIVPLPIRGGKNGF